MASLAEVTAPKIDQGGPVGRGEFVYVDISSVDNKLKRITEQKTLAVAAAPSRAKQRLKAGDVLVSMTRPNLNAVTMVPEELDGAVGSTGFHVLRASEDTEPRWLYYAVQTRGFISAMSELVQGALYPAVRPKDIRAFEIPVPPLDQQKRIVAEIEKQFSRLDEAVATLKRIKANLKRYKAAVLKAAVLKAAVEGRLVETEAELARREGRSLPTPRPGVFYVYAIRCADDSIYVGHTDNLARRWEEHLAGQAAAWTKQHKPIQIVHYEEYTSRQEAVDREKWLKTGYGRKWIKREIETGRARQVGYETGTQLLQRILETRRSEWKGKGKYKEPAAPDTTDLPELPEGWVWATVESLAMKVTDGVHRKPSYVSQGIPFVTVKNLTAGDGISFEDLNYVTPEDHEKFCKRTHPERGDILITKDGTLGVVRLIDTDRPFSVFVSVGLCNLICVTGHNPIQKTENNNGQRSNQQERRA